MDAVMTVRNCVKQEKCADFLVGNSHLEDREEVGRELR